MPPNKTCNHHFARLCISDGIPLTFQIPIATVMRGGRLTSSRNTSNVCPLRTSNGRRSSRYAFIEVPYPHVVQAAPGPQDAGPLLEDLNGVDRAIHVIVVTTSNLINGAVFGAIFGLISGAWSKRSFAGALTEAKANGRSWGAISGMYAGLQTASRVIRNRDDRWNSVVGACGSGAAFTAKGGPRAAFQGCVSFAALSYLIDAFTTPKEEDTSNEDPMSPEVILRKRN